jgi:uncharacterized membrane protein (UPF0127 family)
LLCVDSRRSALRVVTARSFIDRAIGLLGAGARREFDVLRLSPCWAVHTMFMCRTVDVAFTDRSGTVQRVVHRLAPWRCAIALGAAEAWEFDAGATIELGLVPGARLSLASAP